MLTFKKSLLKLTEYFLVNFKPDATEKFKSTSYIELHVEICRESLTWLHFTSKRYSSIRQQIAYRAVLNLE